MYDYKQHYIDGKWVDSAQQNDFDVINPATEQAIGVISLGNHADIDKAVQAARKAFPDYAKSSIAERLALLENLLKIYQRRYQEFAEIMMLELGAPIKESRDVQAETGIGVVQSVIDALKKFRWHEDLPSGDKIWREPIGVCGLITPWNWPINQIVMKVIPALAAGCTMVLKPSEMTPISASLYAQVIDEAGFPAGVFNMVHGDGPNCGAALSRHKQVAMMSFTGSARGGIAVLKDSADLVKKVTLELGGKSPNLVFADADLSQVIPASVAECFYHSGQSCDAPTRMLVEESVYDEVLMLAKQYADSVKLGNPADEGDFLGPVINASQHKRILDYIDIGIEEGARILAGGAGRPEGFERGYYIRPTIFADVKQDMRIYREEIFGPVLTVTPFKDEAEAVRMANDSDYGLAAYIQTSDMKKAKRVAQGLQAGGVHLNWCGRAIWQSVWWLQAFGHWARGRYLGH